MRRYRSWTVMRGMGFSQNEVECMIGIVLDLETWKLVSRKFLLNSNRNAMEMQCKTYNITAKDIL